MPLWDFLIRFFRGKPIEICRNWEKMTKYLEEENDLKKVLASLCEGEEYEFKLLRKKKINWGNEEIEVKRGKLYFSGGNLYIDLGEEAIEIETVEDTLKILKELIN